MKLLLDTHLLLWAVSLWEIAIKRGLGCSDFQVDARMLRPGCWITAITSEYAVSIDSLSPIHKAPLTASLLRSPPSRASPY